jgi:hypothetical protein
MQDLLPHQLPRLLGKYEFIVYFLLFCAEQQRIAPVSRKWIMENMPGPVSPNTVTAALNFLCAPERQLATRCTNGWRLMTEGIQLLLGSDGMQTRAQETISESQKRAVRASLSSSSRDSSSKEDPSTITPLLLLKDETRAESTFTDGARAEQPFPEKRGAGSASAYQLMVSLGVYARKARQLAKLPWVTPEYVQAHVDLAKSEKWDKPVGMAIYRIESEAPMPHATEREDADYRERHKYATGLYAKYFGGDDEEE